MVSVEPLQHDRPDGDFLSRLSGIYQKLPSSGYAFRTGEKINAHIQAERTSWKD